MDTTQESSFVSFLMGVAEHLDGVRDADKALKISLRLAREVFAADEACITWRSPGKRLVQPAIRMPAGSLWDASLLTRFLGARRPKMPERMLVAPFERRGRPWAVLALRKRRGEYGRGAVRDATRVAEQIGRIVERIDRTRLRDVRERIDRKILEQLRPKDLFYQILHGLRSLTQYDHSGALLIRREGTDALELVAEQINWRKGRSERVGTVRPLNSDAVTLLEQGNVHGFDLVRGRWREWSGRDAGPLAEVLDYNGSGGSDDRREMCILCAPLATREGQLGVLKISACHPGSLGEYEARLAQSFLSQAAVAVRNLERTASLESGMLEAEKKHAMADLARGVSHDVNNAFGSVLPLVQQMRADIREGRVDPEVLDTDLEQIEASLQTCRRIFGGMLSFAKGSAKGLGEGNVRRAVDSMLAILQESMRRSGVEVETDLGDSSPLVRGTQGDLEQLLLNLASNARDAMSRGGVLRIEVHAPPEEEVVRIRLTDTGCGVSPENLSRIKEPFFTTKAEGSGLGLSICRSIVWKMRGRLSIDSRVGEGTEVSVTLPTADAAIPGDET